MRRHGSAKTGGFLFGHLFRCAKMNLVVRCPSCNACGEVPDQFFGLRIRCLSCQVKFVLGLHEMVMTPIKCEANTILDYDSIELIACAKCSSLGAFVNHHTSRFYRCPECKTLYSIDSGPGSPRVGGTARSARGVAPVVAAVASETA
jgi:hypothetical protein